MDGSIQKSESCQWIENPMMSQSVSIFLTTLSRLNFLVFIYHMVLAILHVKMGNLLQVSIQLVAPFSMRKKSEALFMN